ncbi:MAG: glycosyltransferase [Planctomycetes bacterium]|nr:glycosyltransferase [Planctomycetota bacterium]
MHNALILGSGRSGTSMVAGSLRRAGYFMGDALYPARDANPLGFFEDPEINGVNEALLAPHIDLAQGLLKFQLWLATPMRRVTGPMEPAVAARAAKLLSRRPFCFKDPRFSFTLPAWRPALGDARFVCVFREPAVTAASIVKECATADYLRGVAMDDARAIALWNATYREILDQHSRHGEWLFLHYDQVMEADGLARLGDFLDSPVDRAFPTRELKRSRAYGDVDPRTQQLYEALCEQAGHAPASRIARVVVAQAMTELVSATRVPRASDDAGSRSPDSAVPELSVLICSYQRKETLLECLRAFDRQTVAPERVELVVVIDGDDDGSGDAVRALPLRTPLRLLARKENAGLAAARSAAVALARGEHLLLVNDDTIAFPDLLERHLAAHRASAKPIAVLGTFEQPAEQLTTALMRELEGDHLVFGYAGLAAGVDHDWMKFWGCNVSVRRDAVLAAGPFDATFRRYGCEDTDLGARLHQRGVMVRFEPAARAWHRHVLTFDDLQKRQRTVARAYVHLFAKHPALLDHPTWRRLLAVDGRWLVRRIDDAARVGGPRLAEARALAIVNCAALETGGSDGAAKAVAIVARLKVLLHELNADWWNQGFAEGLAQLAVPSFAELRLWRDGGGAAWPLATTRTTKLLAWPRFDDEEELRTLLAIAGDPRIAPHRPCLVLRHDPLLDGAAEVAVARLRRAHAMAGPALAGDLEVLLLGEAIAEAERPRLRGAVTCALLTPASDDADRGRFFARVGAPGARGVDDLLAFLPQGPQLPQPTAMPPTATQPAAAVQYAWAELSV